jgi:hypothetical protein
MDSVGAGYGVPFRCLIPKGVDGLLLAGRCISVDEIAFGSTRNLPVCAITAEAAALAASYAVKHGVQPREVPVAAIQAALTAERVDLGASKAAGA